MYTNRKEKYSDLDRTARWPTKDAKLDNMFILLWGEQYLCWEAAGKYVVGTLLPKEEEYT